jgi:hypothetical protein
MTGFGPAVPTNTNERKSMKTKKIEALALQAATAETVDAMALHVQTALGVESGDLAAAFWDGHENRASDPFTVENYIRAELIEQWGQDLTHPNVTTIDGITKWFKALTAAEVAFHPEETFEVNMHPAIQIMAEHLDLLMIEAYLTAIASGVDLSQLALDALTT